MGAAPTTPASGPFFTAYRRLNEAIELTVPLVRGSEYAVWIDSGIKPMFADLLGVMDRAGAGGNLRSGGVPLRFVLHTHSHHDHIGCNAQLAAATGCLIAAPGHYRAWHQDFERHYQEFARPFPDLMPDTPELRAEVLDILDGPRDLDLVIDEGAVFNLGGGVELEAFSFPGHMLAELGYFERSTRTLILGDAVTGLDWPIFHSHLSVPAYRETLEKIRRLIAARGVERVMAAHFGAMSAGETLDLTRRADVYIDGIERTLLDLLGEGTGTLEGLWRGLCRRHGKLEEFRSLNMTAAHLRDFRERGLARETEPGRRWALC